MARILPDDSIIDEDDERILPRFREPVRKSYFVPLPEKRLATVVQPEFTTSELKVMPLTMLLDDTDAKKSWALQYALKQSRALHPTNKKRLMLYNLVDKIRRVEPNTIVKKQHNKTRRKRRTAIVSPNPT